MRFIFFILMLVGFLYIPQGFASENTNLVTADFTAARLKLADAGKVAVVVDSKTILMADGKIIRLLGITYPKGRGDDGDDVGLNAKSFLETLLPKGTEVKIWQSAKKEFRENRMGHSTAHLEVKKTGQWVNGAMVKNGLAWVMTDKSNPELANDLYNLERSARINEKGLWAGKSPYQILPVDKASKANGLFWIVEGEVQKASGLKNNLFLNFGDDTKKDFTVMISPVLRKTLTRQGVDPMGLSGKTVRVRGWMREWNGPFMELETAERLEVLASNESPLPAGEDLGEGLNQPSQIPSPLPSP